MTRAIDPELLLADAAWLRRLAGRLADDRDDADDLAQDAAVAAWRKAPEARASLRPWLGKVVRDGARMLRRGRARRAAREAAVASGGDVRSADDLLAEAELHQALVAAVLALDEPYRRTILARFVDGQPAHAVAQAEGIPAGTVRWRQAEGLRRLRAALDAHAPRRAWVAIAIGAVVRPVGSLARWALTAIVATAVVAACLAWWLARGDGGGGGAPLVDRRVAVVAAPAPALARAALPSDEAPARWVAAHTGTRVVAGRVVDAAERPVAGAAITLDATVAGVGGAAGVQRARADADGRFAIAPRWHEYAVVTAEADGFAPASVVVDPRGRAGAEPDDLVIRLGPCAHRLIGTVRDAGGGAIAGAQIRRQIDAPMPGRTGPAVSADADGRWQLCVPPGPGWIEVGADGYEHVAQQVNVHGDQGLDVALVPAAVISGVVRDAATGAPIVGAAVTLWPALRRGGGATPRGARSDDDGAFAIDGLAGGEYELTAVAPGYDALQRPDVWAVAARAGAPIAVELRAATTVVATVTAAGAPVAGAEVWLERDAGGRMVFASSHEITDSAGRVVLTRVPRATGLVPRIRGWELVTPATIDVGVTSPLALVVAARLSLRGVVVRGGRPVADAEVVLVGPGGRSTGRADGRGAFVVDGLASGPHQVYAAALAVGAFTTAAVEVTLPTAAPTTVTLDGGGAITGRVIDQDGRAVVGVVVTAQEVASDDTGGGPTALDGGFVADALAGGRYRLRVDPYAGAPTPLPWAGAAPPLIAVAGGDARIGPLVLRVTRAAGAIAGRVVDPDGAPVADAFVRLGPTWGAGGAPTVRTTADGRFELPTLGPGPFVVDAGQGGGPTAVLRDVRVGQRDLVLTLRAPAALRGSFAGDDATVWLRRAGGGAAAAVAPAVRRAAVVAGRFAFDGLAPGRWYVAVVTPRGPAATTTIDLRAGETRALELRASTRRAVTVRVVAVGGGGAVPGVACVAAPALEEIRPVGLSVRMSGTAVTDARGACRIDAPVERAVVLCDGAPGWSAGAAVLAPDAAEVTVALAARPARSPGGLGFWFASDRLDATVEGLVDGRAPDGLAVGDRVVAIAGQPVDGLYLDAIYWMLAGRPIGDRVPVTIDRGGARRDVIVEISRSE